MKNSNNQNAIAEQVPASHEKSLSEMSYEELKAELQYMAGVVDDQPYYHDAYIVEVAQAMLKIAEAQMAAWEAEIAAEEEAWAE